ncbi:MULTISPECIES: hypothetical protein [unclassified Saccharopolyspora]|uniref:hypothetical protein n=1 Tax=Saccharopolyspora TaxID=1835 RepID=UPI0025FDC6E6|nr:MULTISPECIES: hypothetical protein [unclassified Saccharopolyspora]
MSLWRAIGFALTGKSRPARIPDGQDPESSRVAEPAGSARRAAEEHWTGTIEGAEVRKVIVACDAGMGSSAMVAAQLAGRLKPYDVSVAAASVTHIPDDADLVLCQETMLERARREDTGSAVIMGFRSFLGDPVFDRVEQAVRDGGPLGGSG